MVGRDIRTERSFPQSPSLRSACPAFNEAKLTTAPARLGPYRNGIFKFTISFPELYPVSPPTITFHTSIYHPLIAPHTPSSHTPGAFSLRHGFPRWFPTEDQKLLQTPGIRHPDTRETSTLEVLQYIKASLDDANVLDEIPISAAENQAAWKAWSIGEAGRGATGGWDERVRVTIEASTSEGQLYRAAGKVGDEPVGCFLVGRVGLGKSQLHRRKWIADLRHGVLNEQIRFVEMDEETVEAVKEEIKRTVEEREACR